MKIDIAGVIPEPAGGNVIGAGSVVTKNVGDDEIWGGAPARLIRKVEP